METSANLIKRSLKVRTRHFEFSMWSYSEDFGDLSEPNRQFPKKPRKMEDKNVELGGTSSKTEKTDKTNA